MEENKKEKRQGRAGIILMVCVSAVIGITVAYGIDLSHWKPYDQRSARHFGDHLTDTVLVNEGIASASTKVLVLSETELSATISVEHDDGKIQTINCYVKGGNTPREQKSPRMTCSDSDKNPLV